VEVVLGGAATQKKTYFEQVPLDAIKKIVEEDSRRQLTIEKHSNPKAHAVEEEPSPAAAGDCSGGGS
jgi:hypothetical protein